MRSVLLVIVAASMTIPVAAHPQTWESTRVIVGSRVRVSTTETVLPSPDARPGRLRVLTGTLVAIGPDTIQVDMSSTDSTFVAIPRILIFEVERSLGQTRRGSAGDAALVGGGIGVLIMTFFPEKIRYWIWGAGYALGAAVGALAPYERWERGWLPEVSDSPP